MTVEVREARPDEHARTGEVTVEAYREYDGVHHSPGWPAFFASLREVADRASRTTVLVAVDEGRILGTITLELGGRVDPEDEPLPPGTAQIRMLAVSSEARGRGVATALMDAAEDRARRSGRTRVILRTTEWMPVARRMYETRGYVRTEDVRLNEHLTLLTYAKDLA